jgi:predicted nucleotidyltransferase
MASDFKAMVSTHVDYLATACFLFPRFDANSRNPKRNTKWQRIMTNQLETASRSLLSDTAPIVGAVLDEFPECLAIHAFGSRVTGHADERSDLDLAVLLPGYADPTKLWNLSEALVSIVGCEVDLLDMRAASTVMQHQILMTGRRLMAKQPEADLFECYVLSEKTALDEARAGLLQDIITRGRIYG